MTFEKAMKITAAEAKKLSVDECKAALDELASEEMFVRELADEAWTDDKEVYQEFVYMLEPIKKQTAIIEKAYLG